MGVIPIIIQGSFVRNKKMYGVSISSETVRVITDCIGKIVFDEDRKEAEETYNNTFGCISFTQHVAPIFVGLCYVEIGKISGASKKC